MEKEILTGEISYDFSENDPFTEFFLTRANLLEVNMPDLHRRVLEISKDTLDPESDSFVVHACPVKVQRGLEPDHPVLLTLCVWGSRRQLLYWPMDMVPLTNEERHDIWVNFVKDDQIYFQLGN